MFIPKDLLFYIEIVLHIDNNVPKGELIKATIDLDYLLAYGMTWSEHKEMTERVRGGKYQ